MKLWLISQTANQDYDTYDSVVVAANTAEEARVTHPGSYVVWSTEKNSWIYRDTGKPWIGAGTWTSPVHVTVEHIGEAKEGTEPGVICASFNAG